MQKPRFFKLTLMLLVALFSTNGLTISIVHAREYIDIVDFAGLPKEDQRQLVKTSQLLMANYEEITMRKHKRRNKYSSLQTLLDLMVKSAHANDIFVEANKSTRLCIYAGWISYIRDGKCPHPLGIKKSDKQYDRLSELAKHRHKQTVDKNKSVYKEFNDKYKGKMGTVCKGLGTGTSAMFCNPKLFGMKENGDPFCSVGNTNPFNSSYGCIKAVDTYAEEEAKKDASKSAQDIKDDVLDDIIAKGLDDHDAVDSLSNMLRLNYDICMCNGQGNSIDNRYAEIMFKERTCYAWLYQTKEIIDRLDSKTCKKLEGRPYQKSKSNGATIYNMFDWASQASQKIDDAIKDAAKDSKGYFDYNTEIDHNDWKTRKVEPTNCPIQIDEKIDAVATGTESPAGHMLVTGGIVEIANKGGEQPHTGWSFTPVFDEDKCPEPETSVENDQDDNEGNELNHFKRLTCEYSVSITLEGYNTVSVTIPPLHEQVNGECDFQVEDKRVLEKVVTEEEDQDEENVTGNTKLTGLLTLKVIPKNIGDVVPSFEGANYTWPKSVTQGDDASTATYDKKEKADITVVVKIGSNTQYTCTYPAPEIVIQKEEDVDKPKYAITLSQKDDGKTKVNVIAVVTKDGEEIKNLAAENLTIDWTKVIKGKKVKSTEEDSDDGTEIGSTTEDDKTETIKLESTDLEKTVEKESTEQDVTAALMKGDEEIGSPKVNIAALEEAEDEEEVTEDGTKLGNDKAIKRQSGKGKFIQRIKGKFFGNH